LTNPLSTTIWNCSRVAGCYDDGETVRLKSRVKGLKPYQEDEEKESLGAATEFYIERCRESFSKLKALMDEQFLGWTTAEIPSE
jgi:hypothetical protein